MSRFRCTLKNPQVTNYPQSCCAIAHSHSCFVTLTPQSTNQSSLMKWWLTKQTCYKWSRIPWNTWELISMVLFRSQRGAQNFALNILQYSTLECQLLTDGLISCSRTCKSSFSLLLLNCWNAPLDLFSYNVLPGYLNFALCVTPCKATLQMSNESSLSPLTSVKNPRD